jgi:iron complex transport system permease protein
VWVQAAAFGFGLLAVTLAFLGSRLYRTAPMIVLTLMGILVGSLFGSLTSLLKYVADPLDALPAITFWLLGGLTGVGWRDVPALLFLTGVGAAFFLLVRWRLNVLSLGDAEATALGMRPAAHEVRPDRRRHPDDGHRRVGGRRDRLGGLVVPHAARIVVGPTTAGWCRCRWRSAPPSCC